MANNGIIEGTNRISVDIRDRISTILGPGPQYGPGPLIGPGPIATCLGFEYTARVSQFGNFTARFPANDPMLRRLRLKRHLLDFYVDGELVVEGMAESSTFEVGNDGQAILVVSGRDMLAELAEVTIRQRMIEVDTPMDDAPFNVITESGYFEDWNYTGTNLTSEMIYGDFVGEDCLSALTRIAEYVGDAFRVDERREFHWIANWQGPEVSGVRAVQGVGDPEAAYRNHNICFIQHLSERKDATRMITTIFPYGSGLGDTQLTLEGIDEDDIPDGFTWRATVDGRFGIVSDAALAYNGEHMEFRVEFKDIRPLFNTDADILYAKNFLLITALEYLKRNDSIDDMIQYGLDVLQLPPHVRVGMTMRVVYQNYPYSIDTDFYILAIDQVVGSNGERTYSLIVAPINQWRLRETNNMVSQKEEGKIFGAHNQIDANTYWMSFREEVGDDQIDHMAEFPFWLSREVVTIRQVLFRFKVQQALIAVKTYTLGAETIAMSTPNTADTNTATTAGVNPASTAGVTTASTDGVSTADTSSGTATITVTGATTIDDPGLVSTGIPNPDTITETNYLDIGEVTDVPVGGIVDATHVHPVLEHQHDDSHTHNLDSHTHPVLSEHGHSDSGHVHPMPHTHLMLHDHNMPHNHSMPHTHNLPALVETFGVELIDPSVSYILADLDYSVNGGEWLPLSDGIPVSGGYSELDITSHVQKPGGLKRPWQENNIVQIRRSDVAGTGKIAQIRAQINIRQTIQSVVIYE